MIRSLPTRLLSAALVVAVLGSCNEKLDLTAPYKENTIVYALLDADSTIQYVKINKAFLGNGDAFIYAQVPDSTEYTDDQLQAVVHAVKNGVTIATYALHDTIMPHDPGIFAGPMHKLYYFNTDTVGLLALDPLATYRIDITAKGNNVSAETPIVGPIKPTGAIGSYQPLRLVVNGGNYTTQQIKWNSSVNGRRYEISYRFNWDEVTPTDTLHKNFVQPIGTYVSNGTAGNEAMSADMDGESFYRTIGLKIENNPAVTQRIFRGVDIIWAVAGDDLHTYLQLNSPISGIVEDRPTFTNVTNGYGLFTTRRFKEMHTGLDANSVPQLVQGQYTIGLLFCVPGSSPPFGCN